MAPKRDEAVNIDEIMRDDHTLERAGRQAVREALIDHKLRGDPIVVWEDGRVVRIPAEEIDVAGDESSET